VKQWPVVAIVVVRIDTPGRIPGPDHIVYRCQGLFLPGQVGCRNALHTRAAFFPGACFLKQGSCIAILRICIYKKMDREDRYDIFHVACLLIW
jgi:hypothetical protein